MQYRSFIHNVLQDASQIALENFGKVSAVEKGKDNTQFLIEANSLVGEYIIQEIQKAFPTHNVIDNSDRRVNNNSDYTWVIDPINGINNFANGVPIFGIMIGLLYKDAPFSGGIALPYFSKIVSAEKNDGVYNNGEVISVTNEKSLLKVLVAYHIDGNQSQPEKTKDEVNELGELILGMMNLRISETSYDTVLVACGNYGGYMNKTSKIWENVAPHIIIEEAGGIYTDYYGKIIDYTSVFTKVDENFSCCAASPVLHEQIQSLIHKNEK